MANVRNIFEQSNFLSTIFSQMADLLQDDFTAKLLDVIVELTKLDAMPRKGVFAEGLGITNSDLNKIERRERNLQLANRPIAIKYLYEHFGINKAWWNTKRGTAIVFDFKPATRRVGPSKVVKIEIKTLEHYQKLEQDLKACQEEVIRLRELTEPTSIAAEPRATYNSNSDSNPDK